MKILIVEDNSSRIRFFTKCFGQYELTITENAFNAIEYLKHQKFNYIFLDNDLGDGNGEGIDVAKFLEGNPGNANYSTIVIVHSWNAIAAKAIKACLPKAVTAPFNTDNFFSLRLDI
jgi:CheY-like chemotaxis protein